MNDRDSIHSTSIDESYPDEEASTSDFLSTEMCQQCDLYTFSLSGFCFICNPNQSQSDNSDEAENNDGADSSDEADNKNETDLLHTCTECKQPQVTKLWCPTCTRKHLIDESKNWTSGNLSIDNFIKKTQAIATHWCEIIHWIPTEHISVIEEIGRGGFSTIHMGKWRGHKMPEWDSGLKKWRECGCERQVVLRKIANPRDFLVQLGYNYEYHQKSGLPLDYFGVTRDAKTGEYMMVTSPTNGSLCDYIRKNFVGFTWESRLLILYKLLKELGQLHECGLVHGDLHTGNVLMNGNSPNLSDLGLCQAIHSAKTEQVCGILPYIAPEVLMGGPYTTASDIYSFGITMWEMTSLALPFQDIPKDTGLAWEICNGARPTPVDDTPECYLEVMQLCWNADPKKRPCAQQLCHIFFMWTEDPEEYISQDFFEYVNAFHAINREKFLNFAAAKSIFDYQKEFSKAEIDRQNKVNGIHLDSLPTEKYTSCWFPSVKFDSIESDQIVP